MKFKLRNLMLAIGMGIAAFSAAPPANALLCTPILGCTCSVAATPMNFSVQPLSGSASTASADITVTCSGVIDALPSVLVSVGAGQSGQFSDRVLKNGSFDLHYNLYTDTGYGSIVGDGSAGTSQLQVSGGLVTVGAWSRTAPIAGRILSAPLTRPGSYTDTVTIRVDY